MTKSRTFILSAIFCCGIAASHAVTLPFDVETPAWNKVVACTSMEGINIRKGAGTTFPRSVYNESKLPDLETPVCYYSYWSSAKVAYPVIANTFIGTAPYISEKDGWYEALGIGVGFANGWVSAKYCNVVDIDPITTSNTREDSTLRLFEVNNDLYAIDCVFSEMNGNVVFVLGKVSNGILVCPYELYVDLADRKESNGFSLEMKNGVWHLLFGSDVKNEWDEPDFTKFPNELLQKVIDNAYPRKQTQYIYKTLPFGDSWTSLYYAFPVYDYNL